jgi:hypothetical protein
VIDRRDNERREKNIESMLEKVVLGRGEQPREHEPCDRRAPEEGGQCSTDQQIRTGLASNERAGRKPEEHG